MNRIEIIKNHLITNTTTATTTVTMEECIKIKVQEFTTGCYRIILNRNEALNSLDFEMLTCLKKLLETLNNDDNCKFVIITSSNYKDRAFCAGGDIKQFSEYSRSADGVNPFIKLEYKLDYLIHTFNKPILSFVNGIVMGGGVGLSLHCSHRIIGENVVWAMPENRIGYFPDVGASYFLSRIGSIGLYLGMVGSRIGAVDMIYSKLASHYIPGELFDRVIDELTTDDTIDGGKQIEFILNKFRKTLNTFKDLGGGSNGGNGNESILIQHKESIDRCFNMQLKSVSSIIDMLEEEKSIYSGKNKEWAEKTLSILHSNCPTSVCVSFQTIHRALTMDIEEVFTMEIRVGTRIGNRNDLVEGVHSSVIDRSHKPKYSPSSIHDVEKDIKFINSFFDPFDNKSFEFDVDY